MDGFQDIQLQCLHPWAEWCVGAVGPANLLWLLFLGWLLCLWHMAEEALAGGCSWAPHICQVQFCFVSSEPPWSSVTFCSTRPQMTWLFYFLRCREDVLVQRDSAGENGFEWINPGGFPPSESFPPFALRGMDQNNSSLIVPMILLLFAPPLFCQIDFFFVLFLIISVFLITECQLHP